MFKGTTLREHFNERGYFIENHELNIIDNYSICDINDAAIDFYIENFKNTECRNINIYYSIVKYRERALGYIQEMANYLNFDYNIILSIMSFIRSNGTTFNASRTIKQISKSISFIRAFDRIGIRVVLKPYNPLNIKPPFHGRYWLSGDNGLIVDGSLNTFNRGKIFAQEMDWDNRELISGFFIREILNNSQNQNLPTAIDAEILQQFIDCLEDKNINLKRLPF